MQPQKLCGPRPRELFHTQKSTGNISGHRKVPTSLLPYNSRSGLIVRATEGLVILGPLRRQATPHPLKQKKIGCQSAGQNQTEWYFRVPCLRSCRATKSLKTFRVLLERVFTQQRRQKKCGAPSRAPELSYLGTDCRYAMKGVSSPLCSRSIRDKYPNVMLARLNGCNASISLPSLIQDQMSQRSCKWLLRSEANKPNVVSSPLCPN